MDVSRPPACLAAETLSDELWHREGGAAPHPSLATASDGGRERELESI
jgi:hypothetical protein